MPETKTRKTTKSPQKSQWEKALGWVKIHPKESCLGIIVFAILVLIGHAMITNQEPTLLGFRLSPMFNQAATQRGVNVDKSSFWNGELSVTARFVDGQVNQPYSTAVTTVNSRGMVCKLAIANIDPKITGATLSRQTALANGETEAQFTATPKTAGAYKVTITASCDPRAGDGPSRSVTQSFAWSVGNSSSNANIVANFVNGYKNKAYTTLVRIPGGQSGSMMTCDLDLVSVKPPIKGARIEPSPRLGLANKDTMYDFKATAYTAGTYEITFGSTCNPRETVKMPSTREEKTFKWTVIDRDSQSGTKQ